MKKSALIRVFCILIFCMALTTTVFAVDLSAYPKMFIADNKFTATVVVGEFAPAEDIIGSSDILMGLGVQFNPAKLSSEITDIKNVDAVVVGNLCTNPIVKDLVSGDCSDGKDSRFDDGEASIQLFQNNGHYQILVGGYDNSMNRIVSTYLASKQKLAGNKVEITKDGIKSASVSLSSYPNMFFDNGEFNGYIIVGKDGTPGDVIAMTNVLLALSRETNSRIEKRNKLDTEISDPYSENIISIGNPCKNKISYELLGESAACEKYTEPGKAYVKLIKKDDNYALIVAAYSDIGIKKITDVLVNYNSNNLDSNYYEINVDEPAQNKEDLIKSLQEKQKELNDEAAKNKQETSIPPVEDNKTELKNDSVTNPVEIEPNKTNDTVVQQETPNNEQNVTEDKGIFSRFLDWIASWFR